MNKNLLHLIGKVGDTLMEIPEGRALFEKVQRGEVNPEEAAHGFLELIQREGLMGEMVKASRKMESLLPAQGPAPNSDPLIQTRTTTGIPQLNPLYEAAIAERAFLDGDVPELRHGPLPEGGHPAVPVMTESLDPTTVGDLLCKASDKVLQEYKNLLEQHAEECKALVKKGKSDDLPLAPTGVPGYLAGGLPALMPEESLQALTPVEAAVLPEEQRRVLAYKALSTTQGRVSLRRPLEKALIAELDKELGPAGINVKCGIPREELETAHWSICVTGPEDLSDNFNYVENVLRYMVSRLVSSALDHATDNLREFVLQVTPFNGISDRRFGWTATLGTK